MMGTAAQIAQAGAPVAAPLVVALLCLYARHRRISGDDLLLWAVAHLSLAITFLLVTLAPEQADPADLPPAWLLAIFFNAGASWLLLFGVVALTDTRMTAGLGLIATAAIALVTVAVAILAPHSYVHGGLLINPLVSFLAGALLVLRRRSAVYVFAGFVLGLRAVNALLYALNVQQAGVFMLPSYTASLSVFFNFLAGVSLLAIVVENAWFRLGAALKDARDARQESDTVLDLAPVSIVRKNVDLGLIKVNRHFREMAEGVGRGRIPADSKEPEEYLPAPALEAMQQLDNLALLRPSGSFVEREIAFEFDDGRPMTMLVRKAAIHDEQGDAVGVISVGLDITRLKEIEKELRRQIEVAEKASSAKSDFLAHMSHELRTPLNGITGYAEMLSAGYFGELNEKQKEYVGSIIESSRHMLSLVTRILDLSQLDSARMVLNRSTGDLGAAMRRCIVAAADFAASRRISFSLEADEVLADVDPGAIEQVFSDLLTNAIKFSPEGSIVQVAVRRDGGRALIAVTDRGCGMTARQIAAVGDLFLRGDPMKARAGGGSGLGLAISRGIVELHGGSLHIDSSPDTGTTVTLQL